MVDSEIQEGDLVKLSTSPDTPPMSVQEVVDRRAVCMWFDAGGVLQEKSFLLVTLVKVPQKG